jgi:hypothetical protein
MSGRLDKWRAVLRLVCATFAPHGVGVSTLFFPPLSTVLRRSMEYIQCLFDDNVSDLVDLHPNNLSAYMLVIGYSKLPSATTE